MSAMFTGNGFRFLIICYNPYITSLIFDKKAKNAVLNTVGFDNGLFLIRNNASP